MAFMTVCAPQLSNSVLDRASLPVVDGYPNGLHAAMLVYGFDHGLRAAILLDGCNGRCSLTPDSEPGIGTWAWGR